MAKYKTSEAQRKAARKYKKENKEKVKVVEYKRKGKKWICEYSDSAGLKEYQELIAKRKKELNSLES